MKNQSDNSAKILEICGGNWRIRDFLVGGCQAVTVQCHRCVCVCVCVRVCVNSLQLCSEDVNRDWPADDRVEYFCVSFCLNVKWLFTVNLGNGSFSVICYYYYYSGLIVIFKTRAAPVCFNTVTSSVQTLDHKTTALVCGQEIKFVFHWEQTNTQWGGRRCDEEHIFKEIKYLMNKLFVFTCLAVWFSWLCLQFVCLWSLM